MLAGLTLFFKGDFHAKYVSRMDFEAEKYGAIRSV